MNKLMILASLIGLISFYQLTVSGGAEAQVHSAASYAVRVQSNPLLKQDVISRRGMILSRLNFRKV